MARKTRSLLFRLMLTTLCLTSVTQASNYVVCGKHADCEDPEYTWFCGGLSVCEPCSDYCTGSEELKPNCKQNCAIRYAEVYGGMARSTPSPPPSSTPPAAAPTTTPAPDQPKPSRDTSPEPSPADGGRNPGENNTKSHNHPPAEDPRKISKDAKNNEKWDHNLIIMICMILLAVVGVVAVAAAIYFLVYREKKSKYILRKAYRIKHPRQSGRKATNEDIEAQNRMRQPDVFRCPYSEIVPSGSGTASSPVSSTASSTASCGIPTPIYGSRRSIAGPGAVMENVVDIQGEAAASGAAIQLQSMPSHYNSNESILTQ